MEQPSLQKRVRRQGLVAITPRLCLPILTPPNNHRSVIRQRPLQRLGFIPRRAHPNVAFAFFRRYLLGFHSRASFCASAICALPFTGFLHRFVDGLSCHLVAVFHSLNKIVNQRQNVFHSANTFRCCQHRQRCLEAREGFPFVDTHLLPWAGRGRERAIESMPQNSLDCRPTCVQPQGRRISD
jgi:hypothetical protein